jgi:hypothetical protein
MTLLSEDGVNNSLITHPGIDTKQRFVLSREQVGIGNLQDPDLAPTGHRKI